MSEKPIFVVTHPRACSTAFERIFMTRREALTCVHEPFGDAFYYGPERLGERYKDSEGESERQESGFSKSTYQTIFERLERESSEGRRLFIKDMGYYFIPPKGTPASIVSSLARIEKGVGTKGSSAHASDKGKQGGLYSYNSNAEPANPTIIPKAMYEQFHFAFLIRHPRSSIPSFYRCTVPPLDKMTGFYDFMPSEAGYRELRCMFDYLRSIGQIGPKVVGQGGASNGFHGGNGYNGNVEICIVDADDLLDNPSGILEAFCKAVGLQYDPEMLSWDNEADHQHAKDAFEKWTGFHEDAIHSTSLKPRLHGKKIKSRQEEDAEWLEKYGEKGAKVIRETVDANIEDYEYLKQFALKV